MREAGGSMSLTDPIADFLTCVRNACRAKHRKVEVPSSRLKVEITKALQREGYISNFKVLEHVLLCSIRLEQC
jgi:small subunit ribosomal protein S8